MLGSLIVRVPIRMIVCWMISDELFDGQRVDRLAFRVLEFVPRCIVLLRKVLAMFNDPTTSRSLSKKEPSATGWVADRLNFTLS